MGVFAEPHAEHTTNFVSTSACAAVCVLEVMPNRDFSAFAYHILRRYANGIGFGSDLELMIFFNSIHTVTVTYFAINYYYIEHI